MRTYPFVRLTEAKPGGRGARRRGHRLRHRRAARGDPGLHPRGRSQPRSRPSRSRPTRQPRACPSCARRSPAGSRGASAPRSTPTTEIVPTLGSKEAIFHLAQVVAARGDRVVVTTPGYPVPDRGALFAGAEVVEVPLDPARGWQPDLDAVDWDGVALLWLNFPNNPTAATAPLDAATSAAAALAREHDFVARRRRGLLRAVVRRRRRRAAPCRSPTARNVVVLNTLSKRSSMPGYRSGFVAGDPELVAALKRYRPNVGVAPQTFVQRAAVAAWSDDAHVDGGPRALPRQARRAAAGAARRRACGPPAATRPSSSGCACPTARTPTRSRCALLERARHRRRPGLVLRPRRRGARAHRARPHARGLPARGASS